MTDAPPISTGPAAATAPATAMALDPAPGPLTLYACFPDVVALIRERRDMKLLVEVETTLRLVRYAPGRIEFQPTREAPTDLAARLGQRLQDWTGARWGVSVVAGGGGATLAEARDAALERKKAEALQSPLVSAVFAAFPGARITDIRSREAVMAEAAAEALPEVPDDWDPFESD